MPEPVLPGDVLTGRGASLPCGCDAHTLLHEMSLVSALVRHYTTYWQMV
jgi:hypothetical protein